MSSEPTRSRRLSASRERAIAMVLAAIIAAFVLAGALLLKHGWENHPPHRGAQGLPAAPRTQSFDAARVRDDGILAARDTGR
jgi:hypothetical protein